LTAFKSLIEYFNLTACYLAFILGLVRFLSFEENR